MRYVQVIDGRHDAPRSRFYDRDWQPQPFVREGAGSFLDAERPGNLSKLIVVAENIASDLEFVKVDLYSVGGKIIFGEMTLAPLSSVIPFRPAA